ncbi:BACON domain-containing protein [Fibrobacter sp.]|uniref:BACON domain-containing protein n=1 Tax=Fibrobacter sp. TaxID=35828 RepID=UPI00386CD3A2
MGKIVRLFIGEGEVDFKTTPDIFYNFTEEDLTNPTVVNNSFSKTITIEGTPNNNKIFGMFWNLDRYQVYEGSTGTGFNPSKKTPFKLYVNGELYESGYVKLDAVRKTGNAVEYDVTLFGGLGEFFYEMSYDDEGNQLTLADLTYRQGGDSSEFDFTINKETIYDAWIDKTPYCSDSYLWHYINFAPCYNGYPDNLSADKALINFSGLTSTIDSAVTSGGTTYTTRNGYALGTLPDKLDEWAVRDLRSWAQRPVFRLKGLFEGINRFAQSKGYTLDLDDTFFTPSNPWYWDSWITLPMLSETNIAGTSDEGAITTAPHINHIYTYNGWTTTKYGFYFSPELPVGVSRVDMSINLRLAISQYSRQYFTTYPDKLYTSANIYGWDNPRAFGGIVVQVLCYDGESALSSNIIGGSVAKILTSKVGEDYLKGNEINPNSAWWLQWGSDYEYVFGTFDKDNDYYYNFSTPFNLDFEVPVNTRMFAINVYCVANLVNNSYQYRLGKMYTAQNIQYSYTSGSSINTVTIDHKPEYVLSGTTASAYTGSESAGYSGAKLTKKALLSTENTPADYLLSYCKQFGLHFWKKPSDKVIHICQRGTFYDWNGEAVDLSEKIDTAEGIDISPLSFDAKWYNMVLDTVEGDFANKYQNTYGRTYGIQKINTGYEFTADEKNILEDNVFRGAVEGVAKDKYYLAPVNVNNNANVPYVIFQGLTYQLYYGTSSSTTVDLNSRYGAVSGKPLATEKYYDGYQKPQFCDADRKTLDGKNVLLIFNGIKEMRNSEGKMIPYYITDDIADMGTLNSGKPCWILTSTEKNTDGTKIAYQTYYIPSFARNVVRYDNYIDSTWDFGQPKELFIPEALTLSGGTIYGRFWKNYLNDLYDVNTRIMRCKVIKDEFKASPELFRKFYWYGNALWRLNKIEDWNIATADKGTAEFVKVNNREAYKSKRVDGEPEITLTVNPISVPQSGGTVTGTVTISDASGWYFDGLPDYVTVTPEQGRGNQTVQITVASTTAISRTIYVTVFGGEYTTASASILQGVSGITVTPTSISAFAAPMDETLRITDVANDGWVVSAPEWITINTVSGVGDGNVFVQISRNSTGSYRTGNIVVTNSTTSAETQVAVSQDAAVPASVTPSSLSFASTGGTLYLNVTDVSQNGWTLVATSSWYTVGSASGSGNASVPVTAGRSTEDYQKSSIIVFQDATSTAVTNIPVYQEASGTTPDYPITVSPTSLSAGEEGGQRFLNIEDDSNHGWSITSPAWATLSTNSGTGDGQVMVNFSRNYDTSARTGSVIVTDVSASTTTAVTLSQAAATPPTPVSNCIINFTYGSVYIPQTGTYDEYTVYYSEHSAHPVGEGMGMLSISCGSPLYSGNAWTPSAGNYWGAYSPFSEVDLSDNTKLSVPSEFAGKTIYLQAEFGSAELGFALESTVVEVQIPANGGTINVTIPDF